jgi:hypothetical protein
METLEVTGASSQSWGVAVLVGYLGVYYRSTPVMVACQEGKSNHKNQDVLLLRFVLLLPKKEPTTTRGREKMMDTGISGSRYRELWQTLQLKFKPLCFQDMVKSCALELNLCH